MYATPPPGPRRRKPSPRPVGLNLPHWYGAGGGGRSPLAGLPGCQHALLVPDRLRRHHLALRGRAHRPAAPRDVRQVIDVVEIDRPVLVLLPAHFAEVTGVEAVLLAVPVLE